MKSKMDDANEVGDAFATEYYEILENLPEKLCKFYKDDSTIVRPGGHGTLSDMDENLNMLSSGGFDSVNLTCIKSQDSQYRNERCILVLVNGYFISNEGSIEYFTQTFTLSPQGKAYFVCVDMFSFPKKLEGKIVSEEDSKASIPSEMKCDAIADTVDPAKPKLPPPEKVGNAFARQYYAYMKKSPRELICFYKDESTIARPGHNGTMLVSTLTEQDRDENLDMLSSKGFVSVEKTSVMSQDSLSGSVLVIVSGYFNIDDDLQRSFTQIFFLAPQEIGYFILNDILLFVENFEAREGKVVIPIGHVQHTSCDSSQEMKCDPVANIRNGNNQESQELRPGYRKTEITQDKDADDRLEDGSKMSYASALKNAMPLPRGQGEHSSGYPSPQIKADAFDDGNNKECDELHETSTVYINNLPSENSLVRKAFSKFGQIKYVTIQNPSPNYYYGFVEFEDANAAIYAIKASPLSIGRREVSVKQARGRRR